MIPLDDYKKIGIGLTGFGIFFTFLGILMFFDQGLLAIGNVLFLSGVVLLIGVKQTYNFFFQWHKAKGTVCFFFGAFLVVCGYPKCGMLIEAFGFLNLFGNFFPVILSFLRRFPIIGNVLALPVISQIVRSLESSARLPV